jgi:hypothetical protein
MAFSGPSHSAIETLVASQPRSQEHGDASGHLAWWIASPKGMVISPYDYCGISFPIAGYDIPIASPLNIFKSH